MQKKTANICIDCGRNASECSWLFNLKPIDGWTANPFVINCDGYKKLSYNVVTCPKYIEPSNRKCIYNIKKGYDSWMIDEEEYKQKLCTQ